MTEESIALTVDPQLETELATTGARFTPVELRLPEDLDEAHWARIGTKLLRADQVMQWWIGDWAFFGSPHPDKTGWRKRGALLEFCKANSLDYGNARNKAWVSGSVHLSLRRDGVRWSLFQEIAPLAPKDQKRWLDKALEKDLTVAALRREIRISQGEYNALDSEGPTLEFGTKYYEDLKAWMDKRPEGFWILERQAIWKDRLMALINQHCADC